MAQAATGQIVEIGSKASIGADVSRAVGQALTAYGAALRAAQELFARGEAMVAQGQAALGPASRRAGHPGPYPAPALG